MSDHTLYTSAAEVASYLGLPEPDDAGKLQAAALMASRWVDERVGANAADPMLPIETSPVAPGDTYTTVPVQPAINRAALYASPRFLRAADVPYGVAGGLGLEAVYISRNIVEAEVVLLGHRTGPSFGCA